MDRQTLIDLHFKFVTDTIALQEIQNHMYTKLLAQGDKSDNAERAQAIKESGRILGYLDCCEIVMELLQKGDKNGISTR